MRAGVAAAMLARLPKTASIAVASMSRSCCRPCRYLAAVGSGSSDGRARTHHPPVSNPVPVTAAEKRGLRCTEVNEHGSITTRHIAFEKSRTHDSTTALYGLTPRDIRKLAGSSISHIRFRPSTVLLHLSHLKVLVQRDRVLLIDDATSPAARDAFLNELLERSRQRTAAQFSDVIAPADEEGVIQPDSHRQQQLAFEFHALEAVLSAAASQLEAELEDVRRTAERALRSLDDDVNRRTLITLLTLSNRVIRFTQQAELVRTTVEDLLERDDHVAALYLTAARTVHDDLTVAEQLLGSYYLAFNGIVQGAENLASGIRNTQESASAMLDASRNTMMLLDLQFRIGTLGLATGSMFAAFYGMNIDSLITEHTWAFPGVSGTSALLAVASLTYLLAALRKLVRVKMQGHGRSLVR